MKQLIVLLFSGGCAAQVEMGVTGGVPFRGVVEPGATGSRFSITRFDSAPRRYTAGPSLRWRILGPVALETGAVYQRFGFDSYTQAGFYPQERIVSSTTGNAWEFPVLGSLDLAISPRVSGFVSGGVTWRRLAGVRESGIRTTIDYLPALKITDTPFTTDHPAALDRRNAIGGTAGAGLVFHAAGLVWRPGLRVTWWDSGRASNTVPGAPQLTRLEIDGLLTVARRFGGPSGSRANGAPVRVPGSFEAGLLGGMPLQAPAGSGFRPGLPAGGSFDPVRHRPAFGAVLDWRWHARASLEAAFIETRGGYDEVSLAPTYWVLWSNRATRWEMPVLFRWRPVRRLISVGAGPAFRTWSDGSSRIESPWTRNTQPWSPWPAKSFGASFAAGLELPAGPLRLRPEFRYSRFRVREEGFYSYRSRRDSAYLVVGITNRSR